MRLFSYPSLVYAGGCVRLTVCLFGLGALPSARTPVYIHWGLGPLVRMRVCCVCACVPGGAAGNCQVGGECVPVLYFVCAVFCVCLALQ